jgi:hypothetical protein
MCAFLSSCLHSLAFPLHSLPMQLHSIGSLCIYFVLYSFPPQRVPYWSFYLSLSSWAFHTPLELDIGTNSRGGQGARAVALRHGDLSFTDWSSQMVHVPYFMYSHLSHVALSLTEFLAFEHVDICHCPRENAIKLRRKWRSGEFLCFLISYAATQIMCVYVYICQAYM